VYLSRSSSHDATDNAPVPGATAQAGPKASKAAVTIDQSADESAGVGRVRNPFKQRAAKVASTKKTDTTSSDKSSQAGGASPSDNSSAGGSTPSSDTPSGGTTPSGTTDDATKSKADVTRVSLHLGPLGTLTTFKDVARLSPLPSAGKPLFVFTGVLKDGKTAVLLPSSTVQIGDESDVSCKPSNKSCQKLELKQDDTVFFKIAGDAQNVQYQLDVVSVHLKRGESANAAAAALDRHSNAGAAMLRDAHVYGSSEFKGAADYRWLPDRGLLDRVPEHGTGAAAASAGDATAALPGLPVWHWQDAS
jgi:hypothetical protein